MPPPLPDKFLPHSCRQPPCLSMTILLSNVEGNCFTYCGRTQKGQGDDDEEEEEEDRGWRRIEEGGGDFEESDNRNIGFREQQENEEEVEPQEERATLQQQNGGQQQIVCLKKVAFVNVCIKNFIFPPLG